MAEPTPSPEALRIVAWRALPDACVAALAASGYGPFELQRFDDRDAALAALGGAGGEVLIADADDALAGVAAAAPATAIVAIGGFDGTAPDPARVVDWLRLGVQDVLRVGELAAPSLPLRLRAAAERKRVERAARTAYATDAGTGLPHQQQLIEHASQLIALRERDPAPLALLVLRIEGLATAEARLGRGAADALRRKVGVRLRAALRASDVVASIGADRFAVLLGVLLKPADAAGVAAKLRAVLMQPFAVAGQPLGVACAIGIAQYPDDGAQPDALLQRAAGLAAAATAEGRAGFANFGEPGGAGADAANDD